MGNNQDPFVKKKQHANGVRDKGTHTLDDHAKMVPNTRAHSEMLPPKRSK